jgi:S-adenosylmethionine/arginine decarboxylase-like enzyme
MEKSTPTVNHFVAYIKLKSPFSNELEFLENIGKSIIKSLNLKVVSKNYHQFSPTGITLVYILSQSHFILHTWPEYNLIHLDLFSCSDITKKDLEKSINNIFPKEIKKVSEVDKLTLH